MSKHTDGPWSAEGPDQFGDYNIVPQPPVKLAVAAVVSNLRPASEVRANAELVASAPQMAIAGEELRSALQNMMNGFETGLVKIDTPADETWANAMAKARFALEAWGEL